MKMNFDRLPVFTQNDLIGELVSNVQLLLTKLCFFSLFFCKTAWHLWGEKLFIDFCVPKKKKQVLLSLYQEPQCEKCS